MTILRCYRAGLAGARRVAANPGLPRNIGKFTVKAQAR
jgi:hypothetical protein